jgi:hypothetical protein
MTITKEAILDRIEIVFVEAEDGNRYPYTQARGKVEIREDGRKIADAGTFRFGAKAPDQDAGDQPDAPDPTGKGKVAVSQAVKDQLRAAQNAHVTQDMADRYKAAKAAREADQGTIDQT